MKNNKNTIDRAFFKKMAVIEYLLQNCHDYSGIHSSNLMTMSSGMEIEISIDDMIEVINAIISNIQNEAKCAAQKDINEFEKIIDKLSAFQNISMNLIKRRFEINAF